MAAKNLINVAFALHERDLPLLFKLAESEEESFVKRLLAVLAD